jgi:hypothetical protein
MKLEHPLASATRSRSEWSRTIGKRLWSLCLITCTITLLFPSSLMAADGRDDYLAIGDSIAFGLNPFLPLSDRSDPVNFVGYPEVVAKALDLNLTNASCPGEASGGFISLDGVDRKCRTFYRAKFPLHVSYSTSHLDFAVEYLQSPPSAGPPSPE